MSDGPKKSAGELDGDAPLVLAPEADAPQEAYGSDPEAETKPNPAKRSAEGKPVPANADAGAGTETNDDAESSPVDAETGADAESSP